jgi:hypothetical protein
MKIKLAITSAFVALLLFGASAIDASPVSLGNASRFAALALNGNVAMSGGSTITGPVGVASASGFSFSQSGGNTFTSDAYIHTGSTISGVTSPPAANIFGPNDPATDTLLNNAITDANNASSQASAMTATANLDNITSNTTRTENAVGNYVYTVGSISNGVTLTISAPPGSTVIVNITGSVGPQLNLNIAGGLTASDVLYNIPVTNPNTINLGGSNSITGILLAPTSRVTLGGGSVSVTGQVIAASVSLSGGADLISTAPVVPEPSSLSLVAIGGVAALGHRFIRRRKSPG